MASVIFPAKEPTLTVAEFALNVLSSALTVAAVLLTVVAPVHPFPIPTEVDFNLFGNPALTLPPKSPPTLPFVPSRGIVALSLAWVTLTLLLLTVTDEPLTVSALELRVRDRALQAPVASLTVIFRVHPGLIALLDRPTPIPALVDVLTIILFSVLHVVVLVFVIIVLDFGPLRLAEVTSPVRCLTMTLLPLSVRVFRLTVIASVGRSGALASFPFDVPVFALTVTLRLALLLMEVALFTVTL